MKIGMVTPYNWSNPGGVRSHIQGLSAALIDRGHQVDILAPADDPAALPLNVTYGGKPINVSYNGSVAGLTFGVGATRRVRGWIREGEFDIVHVHEPLAPSLSVLTCWAARGPIVGTWHLSTDRSRTLSAAYAIAQTALEKLRARIAVSEDARRTLVSHVGGDAVLIPNGVRVHDFNGVRGDDQGTPSVLFLGRLDEPRKGFAVLADALEAIVAAHPTVQVRVAGPGDASEAMADIPPSLRDNVTFLGRVDDAQKAEIFRSSQVYVAPHLGGESFGIVLVEAMAAETPVVASDLPAFRRVLADGTCGRLFARGDGAALAEATNALLSDAAQRTALRAAGLERAKAFDWDVVVDEVLAVYDSIRVPGDVVREDFRGQWMGRLGWRSS